MNCARCGETVLTASLGNGDFVARPRRATKCKGYKPGCEGVCHAVGLGPSMAMDHFEQFIEYRWQLAADGEKPQTPTPQAGPELDAEVAALLQPKPERPNIERPETCPDFRTGNLGLWGWRMGDNPKVFAEWKAAPISTDPGAAFRALEMWREQKAGRRWESWSPEHEYEPDFIVALWDAAEPGVIRRRRRAIMAPTFPLAAALALRSALGGGK